LKKNTHEIVHTSILRKSIDDKGNHQINNYTILSEIGRGGFGKVKLVYCLKKKIYFAMKAANKSKL
jgi:serine/threonine protein kinase